MTRRSGFTLIELLVVLLVILLVSAVTLPAVLPALSHREVSEAARILQAALVGTRDAAIRAGEPRGLRLLADPTLTVPFPGDAAGSPGTAGAGSLAYNRFVPLEMAPDYTEGFVTIGPQLPSGVVQPGFPPQYPYQFTPGDRGYSDANYSNVYPFVDSSYGNAPILMVEQSVFVGGFTPVVVQGNPALNPPTNWYWNVRVGDKIRIGDSGIAYTIVGPMVVGPTLGNPDMFVNVGMPGTASALTRTLYDPATLNPVGTSNPEYLFLVNGIDDDADGLVDEGFDGQNQAPCLNNLADECRTIPPTTNGPCLDRFGNPASTPNFQFGEWEPETWLGALAQNSTLDNATGATASPSANWMAGFAAHSTQDIRYAIGRRPVVSPGAREVPLPANVVIDATSWQSTAERSRLPIDPNTLNVDILVNPAGQVVPTTLYSSPTSVGLGGAFYHFWLAERQDVHAVNELWGGTPSAPNPNPGAGASPPLGYLLPMPKGSANYNATLVLKGDRRLITLFARSGLIATHTAENFDGTNVNLPFLESQTGAAEER